MKIGSNRIQMSVNSIHTLRIPQQYQHSPIQQDANRVEGPKSRRIVAEDSLSPSLKNIIKGMKKDEEEEDEKPLTSIEAAIENLKKQIEKISEELAKLKNDKSESGERKREMLSNKLTSLHSALSKAIKLKTDQEKAAARSAKKKS